MFEYQEIADGLTVVNNGLLELGYIAKYGKWYVFQSRDSDSQLISSNLNILKECMEKLYK